MHGNKAASNDGDTGCLESTLKGWEHTSEDDGDI